MKVKSEEKKKTILGKIIKEELEKIEEKLNPAIESDLTIFLKFIMYRDSIFDTNMFKKYRDYLSKEINDKKKEIMNKEGKSAYIFSDAVEQAKKNIFNLVKKMYAKEENISNIDTEFDEFKKDNGYK